MKIKPELLAPASNKTYKQAIYANADAIYFGYSRFNARADGDNFTELTDIVNFCHIYNVKAYLALNILVFDDEIKEVEDLIIKAEKAQIDGFIISDMGIIDLIKKHSKAPIHASTQLGIYNNWGVKFIKQFGLKRVVLSREVNYDDIKYIKSNNQDIEFEVFIHGALCSAFSGSCLISSILSENSGNRGHCKQLCRQKYTLIQNDKEISSGYYLSAKDICLDKYIYDLTDLNIDSFKIEGRLKRKEYIYGVTKYYNNLLNSYYSDKNKEYNPTKEDIKVLFNRGNFIPGYFENNNVIYPNSPSNLGIKIGQITKNISNNKAIMTLNAPRLLDTNNGYKIFRNNKDIGSLIIKKQISKLEYTIESNITIRIGDSVHLTSDVTFNKQIPDSKRINVDISIYFKQNTNPIIDINLFNNIIKLDFNDINLVKAINQPIELSELKSFFEDSYDECFKLNIINIIVDNIFIQKSKLNMIRREIYNRIKNEYLQNYKRDEVIYNFNSNCLVENQNKIVGNIAEIDDIDKLDYINLSLFSNICYNPSNYNLQKCIEFYKKAKGKFSYIFVKFPVFIHHTDEMFFESILNIFDGVIANNIGYIYIAQKLNKIVINDINLNIGNLNNKLIYNTNNSILSIEVDKYRLNNFKNCYIFAYGYLPLMNLNNDFSMTFNIDNFNDIYLKDNLYKFRLFEKKYNSNKSYILYNSIKTDIGNIYKNYYFYFSFLFTSKNEIIEIQNNYLQDKYIPSNSNKLLLNRKVL